MKRKKRVTWGRGQGGRVGKKEERRHLKKGWRAGTPGHSMPGTLPGRLTGKAQSKRRHFPLWAGGFPGAFRCCRLHSGKESARQCKRLRRLGFNSWGGKILPGEGKGNLPQYACLGNPTDNRAWQATARGAARSQTQLNTHISLALSTMIFPQHALCHLTLWQYREWRT